VIFLRILKNSFLLKIEGIEMDDLKRKAREMFEGKMRDVDDIVEMVVEEVSFRTCSNCKYYDYDEYSCNFFKMEINFSEEQSCRSGWEHRNG
jgi:hypothetical protein